MQLKLGQVETDNLLQNVFKPIAESLKELDIIAAAKASRGPGGKAPPFTPQTKALHRLDVIKGRLRDTCDLEVAP
ncbi:hypothetical protein Trydic_g12807 [Trypoxylus dichotomus]